MSTWLARTRILLAGELTASRLSFVFADSRPIRPPSSNAARCSRGDTARAARPGSIWSVDVVLYLRGRWHSHGTYDGVGVSTVRRDGPGPGPDSGSDGKSWRYDGPGAGRLDRWAGENGSELGLSAVLVMLMRVCGCRYAEHVYMGAVCGLAGVDDRSEH